MKLAYMDDMRLFFAVLNGKVSASFNRTIYKRFKAAGIDLTPDMWSVLAYLWHEDGLTQLDLCIATSRDKPNMTRLLDNLEKRGLVARRQDATDRRSNRIYLTTKGMELKETVHPITDQAVEKGLEGLSEEDLESVRRILKVVMDNLNS